MTKIMEESRIKASNERWLKAQEFEIKTWRAQNSFFRRLVNPILNKLGIRNVKFGDDWNHWWYEKFDFYRGIPRNLDNAIELGCGPYTNIRLIHQERTINRIFCSDPLARQYIKFKKSWLSKQYASGGISLDDHSAEELPFSGDFFDLVLMINVLDHVRDADACLINAIRILKPTGFLVIGQDLTDERDVKNIGEDIGHPIRLHERDLDKHLIGKFKPQLYKILKREEGRNPNAHYGTYLFIGQKSL
jgi:SAM-dependent methyltransferase